VEEVEKEEEEEEKEEEGRRMARHRGRASLDQLQRMHLGSRLPASQVDAPGPTLRVHTLAAAHSEERGSRKGGGGKE